jgi:hypothetical protein
VSNFAQAPPSERLSNFAQIRSIQGPKLNVIMEHWFGDRRLFGLAPSDWSMLVTGIAIAAMFILFV